MTRTPFFWFLLYVHSAFGVVALVSSVMALRAMHGGAPHRRAGWWFAQAVTGLFVTTALMTSLRYTYFLFTIGYAAWYASHQGWLAVAGRNDRPYLAGPLAGNVQHDLAVVLGLALVASTIAMLFQRTFPIVPWGLGLGVAFVWGGVLALFGWAGRSGRFARLSVPRRHVIHMGAALTATWSEFFADVTVHFVSATTVWVAAWIAPAIVAAWYVHRAVDLRACACAVFASPAAGVGPSNQVPQHGHAGGAGGRSRGVRSWSRGVRS